MGTEVEEQVEVDRYLDTSHRCDARNCPAQAWVSAKFMTGELFFCGHHFEKYEVGLLKHSYDIVDEREYINAKSESSPE